MLAGGIAVGGGTADVTTSAGGDIVLDASATRDPDGDALTYHWSLLSRPSGSVAELSGSTARLSFKPDTLGTYVAVLQVSDSKGASAEKQVTMLVGGNLAPVLSLALSASYTAAPTTLAPQKVTVGAAILLDGTGSRDPDGDPVNTQWDLIERPVNSHSSLTLGKATARLVVDTAGTYKVRARGYDPSGAYSETVYPLEAVNNAPQTVVVGTVTKTTADGGSNVVQAALGYTVSLSGAGSVDPDGGTLSHAWTLVSKPAGSKAELNNTTGAFAQFVPDVLGDYVVTMLATNPAGGSSLYKTTVSVKNQRPQAVIGTNATPNALPSGPTLRLPVNTTVTLRGTASNDADGDALTYLWTLVGTPPGSHAALSSATTPTVQMTTDVSGSYRVSLRVTDTAGAYSEQILMIAAGNAPPVAVIDKSRVSVVAGLQAKASAAFSFDDDDDTLVYSWAIDARPAGSSAAIAAPSASQLAFTPDVAGTYVASLTVSDGKSSSIAYLTIRALSAVTNNIALPFVPQQVRYSKGLDRLVAATTGSNVLYIVDPFTGAIRQVPLPMGVMAFNLSPDGKLAAVLHENALSLVDVENSMLLRSSPTGEDRTDIFVTNTGMTYLIGKASGGWAVPGVTVIDGRSGVNLTSSLSAYSGNFYGTQRGIFASTKKKIFLMTSEKTPIDIEYFTLNPATGAVLASGASPYSGDYPMSAPFYLSGTEDLVFTSSGTYFRTDTLKYVGKLALNYPVLSMSHSSSANEAIVMIASNDGTYGHLRYKAAYQTFTGDLLVPDDSIMLPFIGGQQSYGLAIFHSANDNHVAVVQVGDDNQNLLGVRYYVVTR
jgi:hypothetical protein